MSMSINLSLSKGKSAFAMKYTWICTLSPSRDQYILMEKCLVILKNVVEETQKELRKKYKNDFPLFSYAERRKHLPHYIKEKLVMYKDSKVSSTLLEINFRYAFDTLDWYEDENWRKFCKKEEVSVEDENYASLNEYILSFRIQSFDFISLFYRSYGSFSLDIGELKELQKGQKENQGIMLLARKFMKKFVDKLGYTCIDLPFFREIPLDVDIPQYVQDRALNALIRRGKKGKLELCVLLSHEESQMDLGSLLHLVHKDKNLRYFYFGEKE